MLAIAEWFDACGNVLMVIGSRFVEQQTCLKMQFGDASVPSHAVVEDRFLVGRGGSGWNIKIAISHIEASACIWVRVWPRPAE